MSVIIIKTQTIGTPLVTLSAYVPLTQDNGGSSHSTFQSHAGQWYGEVGTERVPDYLRALPYGPERAQRVRAFYESREVNAYETILANTNLAGLNWHREGKNIVIHFPFVEDARVYCLV